MARRARQDEPGTWHHVMNRGIARRTLFEGAADVRFFLSQLARAVRRGEIEIHAFAVLTTHYHLLARSPAGALALAMQQAQTKYSRRFNRGRKRDGALVRGRHTSRVVDSIEYRRALVRYIDANPVEARLCSRPSEYPFGSARAYATGRGPPWLETSWIVAEVCGSEALDAYDPAAYASAFPLAGRGVGALVAARCGSPALTDELDDLVGAAPERVRAWMVRKAKLADGTLPGLPMVDEQTVADLIGGLESAAWVVRPSRRQRDGWQLARTALARDLCGASFGRIAQAARTSTAAACRDYHLHCRLLRADAEYAQRVAELAALALSAVHARLRTKAR